MYKLEKQNFEKAEDDLEECVSLVIGIILVILVAAIGLTMPLGIKAETKPDVGLWLARSCIGEAGFYAVEGECAAIAHVYLKRAEIAGVPYYKTLRQYSGAIKRHRGHTRPWLFGLRRDNARPENWPPNLKWPAYREAWSNTLSIADAFIAGEIPDPLPRADHYGGWVDRHRIVKGVWKRIPAPYRNRFYCVRNCDERQTETNP